MLNLAEKNKLLHILRNPYGWSEGLQREARLKAANELERVWVFELDAGYPSEDLPAYQQRVIAEKAELDAKSDKLAAFWRSDAWGSIPPEEQDRLNRQAMVMAIYSSILGERIKAFQ